jgi:predicted permease
VREGRTFASTDGAGAPRVTVINQTMARRLWPDRTAIGKRVTFRPQEIASDDASWMTVVGVVADARQGSLADAVTLEMFAPYTQDPFWFPPNDLVIRTAGDPAAVAAAARQAIQSVDRAVPITRTLTMDQVLTTSVAAPRFVFVLIGSFAAAAVTLAVVGVYGLMAFAVSRRTREIGLRAALGARPAAVLVLVMRQGAGLVVTGAALGSVGALATTRVIASQLVDVSPTDPLTFALVPATLAAIALIACYIPARRAVRIQPTEALRQE